LLSLSLCLDLGLVNVAVLRTALTSGTLAALVVGVGSSVGDLVYFTLAVAGATALLALPQVRWFVWLGGTATLLYLACRMAWEVARPHQVNVPSESPTRLGLARLFGWGMSLALASPSGVLWFAAVGGAVIASQGGDRRQLAPFALGFFAASVAWSAVLAFAANLLRRGLGAVLVRALSLLSALLFLYLAVVVFLQGLRTIP
jgi:L-lysine exporter family protein LysE/ArgO